MSSRSRRCGRGLVASAVMFVLAMEGFAADAVAAEDDAVSKVAPNDSAGSSAAESTSPSSEPESSARLVAQAAPPGTSPPRSQDEREDLTAAQSPTGSSGPPISPDKSSKQPVLRFIRPNRIWGISGGFESHVVVVQTEPNDQRSRPDKLYNWFFLRPGFYPSQYDAIRAELGVNQHFTADAGESGFRWTDFILRYTRSIPIGTEDGISPTTAPMKGVLLDLEASMTAPTSFRSQNRGLVTVPRARAYLTKAFLDRSLVVTVSGFGEYYVSRYRTAAGGNPNPLFRSAVKLEADYWMPFHKPFSVGFAVDTSHVWNHRVDTSQAVPFGTTPQSGDQPVKQLYGAEVHAGYVFQFGDVNSAVQLAYALGDNTVLHDGVQHLYFMYYRRASEVYATFVARY